MVVNVHGYPLTPLGGEGRKYNSPAEARRAGHCEVTRVVARREIPGRPGVFRDVTATEHRPEEGTYDGAKCKAVRCPNLGVCASVAKAQAMRANHCMVKGKHRPGQDTYDGAKCAAVDCPNRRVCAFQRAQALVEIAAE